MMILAAVRVSPCSQATAPPLPTLSLVSTPQIYPCLPTPSPVIVFLFNAVIHASVATSKQF